MIEGGPSSMSSRIRGAEERPTSKLVGWTATATTRHLSRRVRPPAWRRGLKEVHCRGQPSTNRPRGVEDNLRQRRRTRRVSALGGIDVLVNNSGASRRGELGWRHI